MDFSRATITRVKDAVGSLATRDPGFAEIEIMCGFLQFLHDQIIAEPESVALVWPQINVDLNLVAIISCRRSKLVNAGLNVLKQLFACAQHAESPLAHAWSTCHADVSQLFTAIAQSMKQSETVSTANIALECLQAASSSRSVRVFKYLLEKNVHDDAKKDTVLRRIHTLLMTETLRVSADVIVFLAHVLCVSQYSSQLHEQLRLRLQSFVQLANGTTIDVLHDKIRTSRITNVKARQFICDALKERTTAANSQQENPSTGSSGTPGRVYPKSAPRPSFRPSTAPQPLDLSVRYNIAANEAATGRFAQPIKVSTTPMRPSMASTTLNTTIGSSTPNALNTSTLGAKRSLLDIYQSLQNPSAQSATQQSLRQAWSRPSTFAEPAETSLIFPVIHTEIESPDISIIANTTQFGHGHGELVDTECDLSFFQHQQQRTKRKSQDAHPAAQKRACLDPELDQVKNETQALGQVLANLGLSSDPVSLSHSSTSAQAHYPTRKSLSYWLDCNRCTNAGDCQLPSVQPN